MSRPHIRRRPSRPFPHTTLANALNRVLNSPGIKRRLNAAQITEEWESIAGSTLAQHIQPLSLDKGVLILEADSSVWRQQASFIKPRLMNRIQAKFRGDLVKELRIK